MLLSLCVDRNHALGGDRRFHRREAPAGRREPGAHHVRAREQEADRATVNLHLRQDVRICKNVRRTVKKRGQRHV